MKCAKVEFNYEWLEEAARANELVASKELLLVMSTATLEFISTGASREQCKNSATQKRGEASFYKGNKILCDDSLAFGEVNLYQEI